MRADGFHARFEGRDPRLQGTLRVVDNTGIPTHPDNQTVVKERIYLDQAAATA